MVNYKNIDEYIKTFPADVQNKLQKIREIINKTSPKAVETISYGMPTFKLNGKNLAHFAGYKNHIGFYPTPSGITNYEKELSVYKTSKGAAQFKLDQEIPEKLIEKIIKFRVGEINNN